MAKSRGHLGDPEMQQKLRERERNAERQDKADLAYILSVPQGRRWMWRKGMSRLNGLSYSNSNADMTFNEGRRAFSAELNRELEESHPEALKLMFTEHIDNLVNEKTARDVAEAGAATETDNADDD
jgi:methionine synthase II (cobalamin-independent)